MSPIIYRQGNLYPSNRVVGSPGHHSHAEVPSKSHLINVDLIP